LLPAFLRCAAGTIPMLCLNAPLQAAEPVDLSSAVIVTRTDADPVVRKAVAVLRDGHELACRTGRSDCCWSRTPCRD